MKRIATFLLLTSLAWATNPPANLTGLEVTNQPNLESQLSWDTVTGATYNVYRYRAYSCTPQNQWVEIATGLTTTAYLDTPNPDLGPYCYTVTATVGGIESGFSNIIVVHLGNHWYWYLHYRLPDCATKVATPAGAMLSITQTRNGIQTNLPVNLLNTDTFYGTSRIYDDATYSAVLSLPDGKVVNYPSPIFGTGQPVSAAQDTSWNSVFIQGTDKWCYYDQNSTFQPATSN